MGPDIQLQQIHLTGIKYDGNFILENDCINRNDPDIDIQIGYIRN